MRKTSNQMVLGSDTHKHAVYPHGGCHSPAAPVAVLALILLQDVVALESWALVCGALRDGVAVDGIAVRLGLVPWQLVQVILEELVASRPVLIALQTCGKVACVFSKQEVIDRCI
jgi:hypothetical protein